MPSSEERAERMRRSAGSRYVREHARAVWLVLAAVDVVTTAALLATRVDEPAARGMGIAAALLIAYSLVASLALPAVLRVPAADATAVRMATGAAAMAYGWAARFLTGSATLLLAGALVALVTTGVAARQARV
jgi:hypothetical protein